jgi:putative acetyltransferase
MRHQQDIIVREFRPEDASPLVAIINQRTVAAQMLQVPFTTVAERIDRFGASETVRSLVAEIEGEVVGSLVMTFGTRRRAHVGSFGMGVHEAWQGHGVGSALVAGAIDLADNWYNLRRLEIEVFADNEPAIRLYRRYGFEVEGTLRDYAFRLGDYADAYAMARLRADQPQVSDV